MYKAVVTLVLMFALSSCRPVEVCYNHVKITKEDKSVVWFKVRQEYGNPDFTRNDNGTIMVMLTDLKSSTHTIVAKELFVGVSCVKNN